MKITVTRAFLHKSERQEPGSVIDLPDGLARELIALQKASSVKPLAPQTGPMTTETSGDLIQGPRKRKGMSNARESSDGDGSTPADGSGQ